MVEYRRVGPKSGGGWPETNQDIISALQMLPSLKWIDIHRVGILGHSAGGQLALWCCCKLADRALGFIPKLCIAVAPVCNLVEGQCLGLSTGGRAIADYMRHLPCSIDPRVFKSLELAGESLKRGCKGACQYELASPSSLLPVDVPLILCVGKEDNIIPMDYVERFYEACKTSMKAEYIDRDIEFLAVDSDHFQVRLHHRCRSVRECLDVNMLICT